MKLPGVDAELQKILDANMDAAPARRRAREAFKDIQLGIDHILFKVSLCFSFFFFFSVFFFCCFSCLWNWWNESHLFLRKKIYLFFLRNFFFILFFMFLWNPYAADICNESRLGLFSLCFLQRTLIGVPHGTWDLVRHGLRGSKTLTLRWEKNIATSSSTSLQLHKRVERVRGYVVATANRVSILYFK